MSSVGIIDPEGILKACTMNVRMTSASATAMTIASTYSRTSDLVRADMA
jgi:hypothetical protein